MKAAVYDRYGPPDVVSIRDVPTPEPGPKDILVAVHATTVNTADWRFRAAAFPGIMAVPGRLMAGVFGPRQKILGGEFAGRVAAVGSDVQRFRPGDAVFGFSGQRAHAEFVAVRADGPVAIKPPSLSFAGAAAVPFGASAALGFLRDFAKIAAGERVLVIGASGGVGVYAVQLARHFGAEVDGVCGTDNVELVCSLGATRVFDHQREDFRAGGESWDVILDPVGRTTFAASRTALRPGGRHVFLEFGLTEIVQALTTSVSGDRRVVIGVSGDTREDLDLIAGLLETGAVRPVIDGLYPLERIVEAHARVESRHKRGSVVVTVVEGP
ncbi:MAG: NAD(P)-dependent alcohol dehydrogenase [Bauldia sp.]|nr:NAD(P)-dependent alcohol dehydrogenase [Bauldia sp.]